VPGGRWGRRHRQGCHQCTERGGGHESGVCGEWLCCSCRHGRRWEEVVDDVVNAAWRREYRRCCIEMHCSAGD
jgi:hypothetical protein